jgi:DNA repair protein RecN (Recombination protein N)
VLEELRVENLLLIESAQLRLAPGLNVLTGETGAGKTVLAHALDLLLGGRARPGIVRPGSGEAYVEGIFELTPALGDELRERLPADAGEVILARRVGADGRTRAYLNGRSATVTDLRDIGARLLAFYGQHEHRKLTLSAAQLEILDGICGPDQGIRLSACAAAHAKMVRLAAELDRLRALSDARERELELLEHELAEIDAGAPQEREHEQLLALRERLRRRDALCSAAGEGADALAPDSHEATGVAQTLAASAARLEAVAGLDPQLDSLAERLRALAIESQELARELRDYGGRPEADELERSDAGTEAGAPAGGATLDSLEERLAAIEGLKRKHGGSIQSVLDYGAAARERRDELAGAEVALARTRELLHEARAGLDELLGLLRRARKAAAPRLALAVHEQLSSLAMADASFEVVLAERQPGPSGADSVEFLIAPNPGVAAGPLREIASGGELSRVMLALITASERVSAQGRGRKRSEDRGARQSTLVFDEVDAGIGGHAARAVGARLRELGAGRQVLCITHLPQIASLGERHFSIVKDTSANPTRASVLELAEGDVVSELVRMLGADSDDSVARRHARELRRAA